jgi:hypothetical protein
LLQPEYGSGITKVPGASHLLNLALVRYRGVHQKVLGIFEKVVSLELQQIRKGEVDVK